MDLATDPWEASRWICVHTEIMSARLLCPSKEESEQLSLQRAGSHGRVSESITQIEVTL
jgi:hypothetical protein